MSSNACPVNLFGKNPQRSQCIATYSNNAEEYDQWFENGDFGPILQVEFASVIRALRSVFAKNQPFRLLEIGIGTGRFALQVRESFPHCQLFGLEPAEGMARICRAAFARRSIDITLVEQKAEQLSKACLSEAEMDCVLFVTTLGFLEDHEGVLRKIRNEILVQSGGCVCVAFINGETAWGRQYGQDTQGDKFYTNGTCVLNLSQLIDLFERAGFGLEESACFQTLVQPPDENKTSRLDLEALCRYSHHPALSIVPGYGQGMWSVLTFRATNSG